MDLIFLPQDRLQLMMPHMNQYRGERTKIMFLSLENTHPSMSRIPRNQHQILSDLSKENQYHHPLPLVRQHLHLFSGFRGLGSPIAD